MLFLVRRTSTSIHDLLDNSHNRWLQKILVSATLSLDVEKLHMWNLRSPQLFHATLHNAKEIHSNKTVEEITVDSHDRIFLPDLLKHEVVR